MTGQLDGPKYDDDLIPELGVEHDWPDLTGFIKATVTIRAAYGAFVPKENGIGRPVSGGKETFIRCPSPTHIDRKPSAWMQENEGLWYCAGCDLGGDVFDLAAHATGHNVRNYKMNAGEFGDIVTEVAERMGVTEEQARAAGYTRESRPAEEADVSPEWPEDFTDAEMAYATGICESWQAAGVPGAKELAVHDVVARRAVSERAIELEAAPPEPELDPGVSREIDIALAGMIPATSSEVAFTYEDAVAKGLLTELGPDPASPHVPWQEVIPPDTPLYRMLKACCVTDTPDEYFIWAIYTALGSMIGRRVELHNSLGAVDPAFWTVLLGDTGTSKSTVALEMENILHQVAPPAGDAGTKIIGIPASGEKYLEMIYRQTMVGMGVTVDYVEDKNAASFMYVDEFSTLGTLLSRAGSTLTSMLLQTYGVKRNRIIRPTEAMGRVSFPVTGPMVSILSTTQPSRIASLLDRFDVASGFMNRFIFVSGKPRRFCVPMMGFGPDWEAVQAEFQLIYNRLNNADQFVQMNDKAHVDAPWQLTPDSGGLSRMREWMTEQNELAKAGNDFENDLLARRDLIVLKITLLMALNRICAGDPRKNWIKEDVEAAIAHYPNLRTGWVESGERVLETAESRLEDWIEEQINESHSTKGMAQNQLRRLTPKSMRVPAENFNRIISAMSQSGIFRQVDLRKKGSSKSTKWIMPNGLPSTEMPDGAEVMDE